MTSSLRQSGVASGGTPRSKYDHQFLNSLDAHLWNERVDEPERSRMVKYAVLMAMSFPKTHIARHMGLDEVTGRRYARTVKRVLERMDPHEGA